MTKPAKPFIPLNIAVLTVSDTRTLDEDTSGKYLADSLVEAGHTLAERALTTDCIYQIRAMVSKWIADPNVHAVITTGGTGFYIRDSMPEAVSPLIKKCRALAKCSVPCQKTKSVCPRSNLVRWQVWRIIQRFSAYQGQLVRVALVGKEF